MGGLAVIFFVALYVVIAFKVVGKFKASRYKWLAVALIVLIPGGDAVVGRVYLKYLCADEGGLKVYRVAEHVEGFMDDYRDYWVKNREYQFSEDFLLNGKVTRYSKQNGQIVREGNVMPRSQYRVSSSFGNTKDLYLRSQFVVETLQGEVLATDTQISFNGGWAERFLALFSDAGGGTVAWCTNTELDPVIRHRRIVLNTLKPQGE
ncbi:MAG: hypothetical protein Q7T21_03835 [Gallionella sp.]|nr:hypothetical protein [Gallionella sp.]